MRFASVISVISALSAMTALTARPVAAQDKLGTISFPSSGSKAARADFIRGVLLLHSFEYQDALAELEE